MSVRRELSVNLLDIDFIKDLWCSERLNAVGFVYTIIDNTYHITSVIERKGDYFINPFLHNELDMFIIPELEHINCDITLIHKLVHLFSRHTNFTGGIEFWNNRNVT